MYVKNGGGMPGGGSPANSLYWNPCNDQYQATPPDPGPCATATSPNTTTAADQNPWQWGAALNIPALGPLNPIGLSTTSWTPTVGDGVIALAILFIILLVVVWVVL